MERCAQANRLDFPGFTGLRLAIMRFCDAT
ncbi:hypothetical protein DSM3645_02763 [Blastopirellula marina DSM 3645]|uniref:Uncharacterized protein n=1 Tax=Blastopirellula marina DSM 3645 TaxID=314230 RepID=A3ZVL6_9BACT|nr:hypothetical protein DSM3645_02763 [Blastopirellula marina DSM 3645]